MTATPSTPAAENTTTGTADTAALEVALLHPDALDIGENVRDTVDLDEAPEFVESIREHGVLEAISAVRMADGTVVVRDGQRRTLAARMVGLSAIPVVIRPDTATSDKARQVDRIGKQITANRHRTALTADQETRGVAQMFEYGASITKISKTLAMDKKTVKAQVAVGTAEAARRALDGGQFDLEQAAILAEFEAAGDTDAAERLLRVRSYDFAHVAARIRSEREEARARAEAAAPYLAAGFTVPDMQPHFKDALMVSDLLTADGAEVTQDHIDAAPTFWTVWLSLEERYYDKKTGERVEEDEIDWDTEDDDETSPADGFRHANTVEIRQDWVPEYLCHDYQGAGLQLTEIMKAALTPTTETDTAGAGEDMTEEQKAAAVARALREAQEKDARDRRRVRELNKQSEAAATVRREFLSTTLLTRKTPPKTAAVYIATILAADSGLLSEYKATETLAELLGYKGINARRELAENATKASETRAQVLTLALVLAAQESRMVKDAWRSKPRNADKYLSFLAEQGYTLAAVEEVLTGQLTADEVALD